MNRDQFEKNQAIEKILSHKLRRAEDKYRTESASIKAKVDAADANLERSNDSLSHSFSQMSQISVENSDMYRMASSYLIHLSRIVSVAECYKEALVKEVESQKEELVKIFREKEVLKDIHGKYSKRRKKISNYLRDS